MCVCVRSSVLCSCIVVVCVHAVHRQGSTPAPRRRAFSHVYMYCMCVLVTSFLLTLSCEQSYSTVHSVGLCRLANNC